MTNPTVLRATSSADFLAALPQAVGFTATNCCFIMSFNGNKSDRTARIDLPENIERTPDLKLWYQAVRELARYTDAVALILTTEAPLTNRPWNSAFGSLAGVLAVMLAEDGCGVKDICVIAPDGWASFASEQTPPLRELSEINRSPLASSDPLPNLDDWRARNNRTPSNIAEVLHLPS